MNASRLLTTVKASLVGIFAACLVVQLFVEDTLTNAVCSMIAVVASSVTIIYTLNIGRFRRTPMSSLMILGFNVSAFSAALIIQTIDLRPLVFNLSVPLQTFLVLGATQALVLVVHWAYLHSGVLLGTRFLLSRRVIRPLGLLKAPSDMQLWMFGLVGCLATVVSASSYGPSGGVEYGDVSGKFLLGYMPFAVAPFFIPLRSSLLGGTSRSQASWILLLGYALLLIAVAMVNNARATFATGFLTLALSLATAVLSGNLLITKKVMCVGALIALMGLPLFSVLSNLATAMVIARDLRSNVSGLELIEVTLTNFQDQTLIEDRRHQDDAVMGADYNENYINNPIFARFVYTKFTDINMSNALSLSDTQAADITTKSWSRILALLPTPILSYFRIEVDKTEINFSSGDIYSFIAQGLELGGYTTGSEIPDGLTIFGALFWPVLAILVLIQFIVYDSQSAIDRGGRLRISPVALLNIVPVFTLGVMQESVANQVIAILRGIPQSIVLYLVIAIATWAVDRLSRAVLAPRAVGAPGIG